MFPQEFERAGGIEGPHPCSPLPQRLHAGCFMLEPCARRATVDSRALSLTTTEYDMLALLVERAGRIVSRDEMFRIVFGRDASVCDRALDVHLSHLRGKLGVRRSLILTVRGVGHLLRIDSD